MPIPQRIRTTVLPGGEAVRTSEGQWSGPHLLARNAGLLNSRLSAVSSTFLSLVLSPSRTRSSPAAASASSGE